MVRQVSTGSSQQIGSGNYDLIVYDEVDSTNSELLRQLKLNQQPQPAEQRPLAIVALSQTAGRGRLGRSWHSQPGGVYLSLNLAISKSAENNAALSLIVALGVYAAFEQILQAAANTAKLQIKWPNDIVCSTGKLAGILLEATTDKSLPEQVIVGVGVNVQQPTAGFKGAAYLDGLFNGTQQYGQYGQNGQSGQHDQNNQLPPLPKIAQIVVENILASYNNWQNANCDFAGFVSSYNAKLSILNSNITVRDINNKIIAAGIATGVDAGGRLLVQQGSKLTAVSSGDVTLR
jgi:BirA family biotin operon repressor/biotin-[acetyl-CoA-carboxylase] ligase